MNSLSGGGRIGTTLNNMMLTKQQLHVDTLHVDGIDVAAELRAGGLTAGDGLTTTDGVIALDTATDTQLGGVTVGPQFTAPGGQLRLNAATSGVLGGVKIRDATSGTGNDQFDLTTGLELRLKEATTDRLGGFKVGDGVHMTGSASRKLSVKPATTTALGGVIVGNGLSVDTTSGSNDEGKISVNDTLELDSITGKANAIPGANSVGGLHYYFRHPTTNAVEHSYTVRKALDNMQTILTANNPGWWMINSFNFGLIFGVDTDSSNNPTGGGAYVNDFGNMEYISTTQGNPSDDRLKFNETELSESRAIELLSAVPISEYRKTQVLMSAEEEAIFESGGDGFAARRVGSENGDTYWGHRNEIGMIAQRLTGTAAEWMVTPGDENRQFKVHYDSLTSINTRVLQGLLDKVDTLNATVQELQARVTALGG